MNTLFRLLSCLKGITQRANRRLVAADNRAHLTKIRACGQGVGIWGEVTITGHENISIGDNVHIGAGAFIRGEGGLIIGANTHISRNVLLYTMNHNYSGDRLPYDDTHVPKSVTIGRNVWIGMNVCITPGSRIGDGAIVGMGTVVSGEVPPLSIIGSQKWRVLGSRDASRYEILDAQSAYAGPNGDLYSPSDD